MSYDLFARTGTVELLFDPDDRLLKVIHNGLRMRRVLRTYLLEYVA